MSTIDDKLINIIGKYYLTEDMSLKSIIEEIKNLFGYSEDKSLEERKEQFIATVRPYVDSGQLSKDTANSFCNYWLEIGNRGRKFRFEKEKSWSLERRLDTWLKNEKKFSVVNMLRK